MCKLCEDRELDRRTVLGAGAAAIGLPANAAFAEQGGWDVRQSPLISALPVAIPLGAATIGGFLAYPRGSLRRRAAIIMHGNPGVSDDVANTAAQLAVAGFVALAIDWAGEGNWRSLGLAAIGAQQLGYAQAGLDYLKGLSSVRGERFAFVGFCGGARTAFEAAARGFKLDCIVSFYGAAICRAGCPLPTRDPDQLIDAIRVPVQGHYGEKDQVAPPSDATPFFAALRRSQPETELFTYSNAGHRFYNMSVAPGSDPGFDFVPDAAEAAHHRMVAFLRRTLA